MESRDRYIQWLIVEIGNYINYHNHKETMAWVATVFYIPSVIALGYGIAKIGILTSPCAHLITYLIITILFGLVVTFIHVEFERRWHAADLIWVMRQLVDELCSGTINLENVTHTMESRKEFPKFIQDRIDQAGGRGYSPVFRLCVEGATMFAILLATGISLWIICALKS